MSVSKKGQRTEPPASAGAIFGLILHGVAVTRGAIARHTDLAASTVSLRVDTLIERGLIEESGLDASSGGRHARILRVRGSAGTVVAASLGTHHLKVLVADLVGAPLAVRDLPLDASRGPRAIVGEIWQHTLDAFEETGIPLSSLRGLAFGVPAPVDSRKGSVSSSAQLPGWDQANLYTLLREHTSVPIILENDANLLAVAEFKLADPTVRHLLAVKVGSRIGSGIISNGLLNQGASGAAGEISHTPTAGTSAIHCSCGVDNCLESVAGGSAIIARLRLAGHDVSSTADLIELASIGDPITLGILRESGQLVGEVLASVVNFINPNAVVFGGSLSAANSFVAAVRGVLFQRCLPVVTDVLDVREGGAGPDAEVHGAIQLILETILTAEEIDRSIASGTNFSSLAVNA